jgi:CheY-like chemotaxis protein
MVPEVRHPIRILLIEDNADDVVLVREALRDIGGSQFALETCTRLAEGTQRLSSETFDVVLLDLALPDSFGIATFMDVRASADELPVVILSGDANDAVALQALELGAQDYLVKGVMHAELLGRTLRYAITRQRLTAKLQESENWLRLLAEQLPAILWTTNRDLCITSWRGRDLESLKLGPEEVVGRTLYEMLGTDNPAHPSIAMHRSALEDGAASGQLDFSNRWYNAHLEQLTSASGEVIGTIGVAMDVTYERKLQKDIEAAHRVQQHMLPSFAPDMAGFDIAGACYPAEHCSGDFFDYIPLPDDRLAVVLADVSGHGFGPAIMASAIRSYLRTAAVLGNHVHEMLALCNRLLVHDAETTPFASVFAARIDSPSRSFQFASAGHPAFLLRRDGSMETLETKCVPIGVREDEIFPLSRSIHLHRGEILVLASDGVFETRREDGDFLGIKRAMDVVREAAQQPAREVVDEVYRAACEFAGSRRLDDDLTVVVVKRRPSTSQADRGRSE